MGVLNEFLGLNDEELFTMGVVFMVLYFFLAIYVVKIVATWKLYKKAGKKGWKSIIPFYNKWVLTEIAEVNWWWFLLLIISSFISFPIDVLSELENTESTISAFISISFIVTIANFIANLVVNTNIAKKFSKNTSFGVLMTLFPVIGISIIAFGKNQYNFSLEVSGNGVFKGSPIDKNKTIISDDEINDDKCPNCQNNIDVNLKYCPSCGEKLT